MKRCRSLSREQWATRLGVVLAMSANAVGLGNFLEQVGIDPIPEMVAHPRTNPYIFFELEEEDEDEDEE